MNFVTIYEKCDDCHGDGVKSVSILDNGVVVGTTDTPCELCSSTGKIPKLYFNSEVLTDIMDKLIDVKEKVDDIMTKLNEPV